MSNSTSSTLTYFILEAFLDVDPHLKYLCFVLIAMFYVVIVLLNVFLVLVICMNRSLHKPMYMFLCSLFVNELYGSTGLFPFLLIQILSDVHTVSAPFCFLQIFCLYSYVKLEFCHFAVMSYDRYVAICRPLQYHAAMTHMKVVVFIVVLWLYSFVTFIISFSLTLRLTLCGNTINGTFCRNYLLVKLACSDTTINNIYGLFGTFVSVLVPLLPILFSYSKILQVCFTGSRLTRQKAFSTCSPHLASLLNFSFGCLFEILQSRFEMSKVPKVLQVVLSLYFVMLQPVLSPLVYGMQMSNMQTACKQVLFRKKDDRLVKRLNCKLLCL